MTALARFRAETSSLMALRAAIDLGEFLTVFGTFTPTAGLARFVTNGTVSFGLGKVVDVNDFRPDTRDDLLPINRFHVAQIVVVEQAATSRQNI